MFKIDAHNHPDFCRMNFEKHIKNMDEYGIDKTCLLSWENPWDENYMSNMTGCPSPLYDNVPIPFERCLDYYEKAPERFILGYAPDPRHADALVKLKSAVDTYGVQICGEVKFRMMYDNPDAVELFRYCGEMGLPVILHIDNADAHKAHPASYRKHYWYGGDIYTLDRLLELCPETNFLGHAPGFWGCISNDDDWKTIGYPKGPVIRGGLVEQLLEKHSNLYCDCSAGSGCIALSRDPEYTKELMPKFPDRFIYARDEFGNDLSEFIDSLGLPENILEGFYHKNLEALLPEKK